ELQHELHDLQVRVVELEEDYEQVRRSHDEMEAARDKLADLYDFAPIVYLSLDADCRIQHANLTAAALFGRAVGILVGTCWTAMVAPGQRAALRAHVLRCLSEQIRVDDELSFSVRGRPIVTAQVTSMPIIDREGRAVGCKMVIVDISPLKWSQ